MVPVELMEFLLKKHEDSARTLLGEIRERLHALEQGCCVQYWCHSDENGKVGFCSSLIRLYNRAFAAMRSTEIMTQHVRFVQVRKEYRNRSMIFSSRLEEGM